MTVDASHGPAPPAQDLSEVAREKLRRVLGEAQGERVFVETLKSMKVDALASPDALYEFGERVARRGGIEAAVGRLLCVAAVVRGSTRA
jgi:hypothetical protein